MEHWDNFVVILAGIFHQQLQLLHWFSLQLIWLILLLFSLARKVQQVQCTDLREGCRDLMAP